MEYTSEYVPILSIDKVKIGKNRFIVKTFANGKIEKYCESYIQHERGGYVGKGFFQCNICDDLVAV